MLFFKAIPALCLLGLTSAAAIAKRQEYSYESGYDGITDIDILNFALTLEYLEATFYNQGMSNYTEADFEDAGFPSIFKKIEKIRVDENEHVKFLIAALQAAGVEPIKESEYIFSSTDVRSFLAVAQILEGVGISAYLGAAPLIKDPAYLSAAGSILTIEARHNAFIRYVNGQSPFPTTLDAGISPRSVVTLAASMFVPGAPNAPALQAFPMLTVAPLNPQPGDQITVSTPSPPQDTPLFCAFLSGTSATFAPVSEGRCRVPTDGSATGQTYIFLTWAESVSDISVVAGPAIVDFDLNRDKC
ncbi:hypothetical protein BT69DRAFT_1271826 [Atractiella rhizophila]|nr:hypothetical protein BT69DRAFT_1271826 [Atractiella rhizophila]